VLNIEHRRASAKVKRLAKKLKEAEARLTKAAAAISAMNAAGKNQRPP
jgi:multidrug resistance efflux pump